MDEWIAGKHAVLEAIRSGRTINKIWVAEGGQKQPLAPIMAEARQAGITVQYVDKRKLDQWVIGVRHQGIAAQAAAYDYADVDDVLGLAAERGEPPFVLLLDEIEDPHNLGSILRTADCAGAHGAIIPKRRSAALNATVAKTSAGAAEYVKVSRVSNLAQTIDTLKKQGVWIVGTDAEAEQDAFVADLTGPIALVVGNEHKGMGRLIKEKCDFLVKLPMLGHVQSLNASVAAGIMMYEVVRQRRAGAGD